MKYISIFLYFAMYTAAPTLQYNKKAMLSQGNRAMPL